MKIKSLDIPEYKKGSARAKWYTAIKRYDGKDVDAFVAATIKSRLSSRELREERGLSQAQLTLEAELDQSFLSLIERGDRQPSLGSLFALCDALEVAPEDVIRRLSRMKHLRP